jgi:TFIIF-interacting CTD phosphatase-like protein
MHESYNKRVVRLSCDVLQQWFTIYVALRPHVQHFLERASACFELVIFTASEKRSVLFVLGTYLRGS